MAIKNIEKFATVKAPAVKIRDYFNNYLQVYGKLGIGRAEARGYAEERTVKLVSPVEYNAGTVYIADVTNKTSMPSNPALFHGSDASDRDMPVTIPPVDSIWSIPDNMPTTTHIHNLRGYVKAVKVSDFATGRRISRLYTIIGSNVSPGYTALFDSATKIIIDEKSMFADYIVPVITWYYDDNDGNTKTDVNEILLWYFFSATKLQKMVGSKLLDSVVAKYSTFPLTKTASIAFTPPYATKIDSRYTGEIAKGVLTNGMIYTEWQTSSDYVCYLQQTPDVPYTMLGCFNTSAVPNVYARNLAGDVGKGYATLLLSSFTVDLSSGRSGIFPAYKTVDDVISLFADYGIRLFTDENEAADPPPSDDGKINPDNPSEQIPYYPDNSTEKTPIEQAYITPSTFGQSCVYTPLTTKDFLRWICDNTVDINNWSRLFANPVDVIMGINLYNLDIVAHDTARVAHNAQTNILGVSTNIPNYSILDGYNNIVDGGTLTLQAYYGNYADFTSMTYQMFIPFVGFTTLRACDVVNRTLHLYYAVDFATGAAVAFVNSDDRLIYTAPCNVAGKIPVSTSDKNSQMINNTLSAFSAVGGLLGGIASGNVGGGVGALLNGLGGMQMQTNYANKGSLSSVNIYKLLPAFVERTRYDLFFPSGEQQYLGAKYQSYAGAPSTQFDTLLNCVNAGGFVQSDVVYLTSQTATDAEKEQIISLIKSGIYL